MNEEDFKPDILDDEALQIYTEPGLVTFQTPSGSIKILPGDWKRISRKLKKL